jgi:hypothetical protein
VAKTKWARPPVGGPIVIPNCSATEIIWSSGSTFFRNTIHSALTAAGPLNPAIAETIFSALKANAATTPFLTHIHPSVSLYGVRVKDMRAANNPKLVSTGAALPGTSTSTPTPLNAALAVTLRTAQSGRGFVGRIYLAGLAADQIADTRHWISTVAFDNAMLNFVNAINSSISASIGQWVIGQRALAASPDPGAPPPYNSPRPANTIPITGPVLVDHKIDSQRKRTGRV